ncbi:hypothetical protein ACSNOK_09140 [Streptomyces sp. URMC 126]|uniref:hypothetical protein n=1 Tax=Streptomyces sp. URMC 126 TaxID=3423401 RepID=UPI003F1B10E1
MKNTSRATRRIVGTGAAVLLLGAGALAGAFAKGSKVKASLHYFDPNAGFSGFRTERTVTL